MHCHDARILLEFGLKQGELSTEDSAELDRHLHECEACRTRHDRHQRMDAAIRRAMMSVVVPPDAQSRLVQQLRRDRQVRRRWLSTAAGIAAALLLSFGAYGYWWATQPLPFALEHAYREMGARALRRRPEDVKKWFAQNGALVEPPTRLRGGKLELDYLHLHVVGFERLQGVEVPYLLFQRGDRLLHIYMLSESQFDLTGVPEKPGYGGPFTMELLSGTAGFRYLAAYTWDLETFCKRRPQA